MQQLNWYIYGGNEDNWNAIYIGEEGAPPESAIIHYNSADFGNTDIPTISGFSASKDGWCLTNTHATFGYDNNYHIPAERYMKHLELVYLRCVNHWHLWVNGEEVALDYQS